MKYTNVAIPAGSVWSSPFVRWQGVLADVSSLDLAAAVTTRALSDRSIDVTMVDEVVLGLTIPQQGSFFGAPTLAARIGIPGVTGPMVAQACATGVAALHAAAATVSGGGGVNLVVTTDRTSNGPSLIYPASSSIGGSPTVENLVQENFARDPWAGTSMLAAAELVASENGVTRSELDDVAALRFEQYQSSFADDRAFQRAYLVPVEVFQGRRSVMVEEDTGIRSKYREDIAPLRPVVEDGLHTGATQTHPADGAAGALVTTLERAREISGGAVIEIVSSGFARVERSHMPEAPVPAAMTALADAGLTMADVDAVTTHNPFAVNDVIFSRATGRDLDKMNNHGCSLIWGHPQAPTGTRAVAELITELTQRGGGVGLFTGCAAGDTAGALVVRVQD
ncbi:thiolase family protein [[Mycobacterium] vasticus]|uniref:Probable acetyl-CoA acetyltransferase n=1 Tax=[Mycobacterium] vasticus TaxID=2875777 RepID=A0ABU5Z2U9_9MYCO|nr:thiolase family protein [Mycolicibacter sp. MYC017]MEB3071727.1 thiolase family protein [Mycolicibacter sp. MYC017]